MFNTISQALENFCTHQIRKPYILTKNEIDSEVVITYIDIESEDNKLYRVYVASDNSFLQTVTTLFLEEEDSDKQTMQDMMLELANLIVGSAKVIAENGNATNFNIKTPILLDTNKFDINYDQLCTLEVENKKVSVAIKELNE